MKKILLFVSTPSLNCVFSASAGITIVLRYQSSNFYVIGLVIYLRSNCFLVLDFIRYFFLRVKWPRTLVMATRNLIESTVLVMWHIFKPKSQLPFGQGASDDRQHKH